MTKLSQGETFILSKDEIGDAIIEYIPKGTKEVTHNLGGSNAN